MSALTRDDLPGESATIIADLEMNLYRVGRNIDNQVPDYDLIDLNTDLTALAALITVAQEQISKAVAS